jgi:hypothetical protein
MIPLFWLGGHGEERRTPPPTATFLEQLFDESKQKSQAQTIYFEKKSGSLEKH